MDSRTFVAFLGDTCGAFALTEEAFGGAVARLGEMVEAATVAAREAGFEARNLALMAAEQADDATRLSADTLTLTSLPGAMSEECRAALAAGWASTFAVHLQCLPAAFAQLRRHRQEQLAYFARTRHRFHGYLRRPSPLQSLMERFQASFNSLPQDMRFEDESKAEGQQQEEKEGDSDGTGGDAALAAALAAEAQEPPRAFGPPGVFGAPAPTPAPAAPPAATAWRTPSTMRASSSRPCRARRPGVFGDETLIVRYEA